MRGYSLRSAYPLARSSQARRRLMLLYNLSATQQESAEPPPPQSVPSPHSVWEAEEEDRTLDAEELRRIYAERFDPEPEDESPIEEDIFHESELRNEALHLGRVSESVLDEDEADEAESQPFDESVLSSSLGDESMILSAGDEESRIFSMEDLREPPDEEMPGSQPADRKPHFPSWYVPNFKTVKRLLDSDKPVTWMFAGESAASATDLAQGRRNFTDHFSDRIRTELARMLDVVINTGNTGETASSLLKNIEWRVLRFHPEVVSILIGRKDSERGPAGREPFRNSLEQIVEIVRESGAILVLHTPNRIDAAKAGPLADLEYYVRILRDVAREYNLPLVDHWEHWKQQKPSAEALRTWLAADGVQPGVYGQREMAKLIFHRFEIFDPASPICNARVP
jgi:acyl-CoA thioesterase I